MAKTSESDVWDQDPPGNGRAGSTFVKRAPNLGQASKAGVVRDDWDDDDDDEEEQERDADVDGEKGWDGNAKASGTKNDGTAPGPRALGIRAREGQGEEDSSKIWEEANKRAPMPELIVASASTSQSLAPLPPAALQPTLRILKRPSPNASAYDVGVASSAPLTGASSSPGSTSGSGSGVTSPVPRGTLAQREAQYQEARSRIFGGKEKPGCTSGHASSGSSSSSGGVVIVRDPFGPASEPELGGQDKADGPGRPAKGFGERRRGRK